MHTRAVLALAAALAADVVGAQSQNLPQFDLERLTLDPAARGSLVVGNGEVAPAGAGRVSLAFHYEREPLVLLESGAERGRGVGEDAGKRGDIVSARLTVHAGAAFTLFDHLELDLRFPWIPWQQSDDLAAAGVSTPRDHGFGTPSVGLKWGFLRQEDGSPVSAAVAGDLLANWGTAEAVAGSENAAFTPRLEVGRRLGQILVAAQGGGLVRTKPVSIPTVGKGTRDLHSEVQAAVALATTEGPLRFEVSGRGAFNLDGLGESYEALVGARWLIGAGEFFALGGAGLGRLPGTPLFRVLFGVALNLEPEKPAPVAALPPPAPAPAPPPPPAPVPPPPPAPAPPPPPTPAPAPPPAAPPTPAPLPAPPPPDTCEPGQQHTPEQCPDLDDDWDGVSNAQDKCPLEEGIPELKGCRSKDSDGDGIPNHLDKCPDKPGTSEYQGCLPPRRAELKVERGVPRLVTKEAVHFDPGKATIQKRSNALLDDVAQVLRAHPKIKKVIVEGHTDDGGNKAANMKLSQDRAGAVRKYLIGKGIAANRIGTRGWGATRQKFSNKTAAGREKNRRVGFVVSY
ncbi:MAG: hypothetical protein A2V77_13905 [Anaeromyxobacter sp. RBG_16_69_14]|nr:MAG: hypothetical protein A2V77_13905 [Anaeromyxobacter sp. RBG_16_69_14]